LTRAMLIDLVAVGAHLLGAAKRLIPGRQYLGRPHFIRDLLHHSVLWRRNRDIPPVSSHTASRVRPATTGSAATQPRTWLPGASSSAAPPPPLVAGTRAGARRVLDW